MKHSLKRNDNNRFRFSGHAFKHPMSTYLSDYKFHLGSLIRIQLIELIENAFIISPKYPFI